MREFAWLQSRSTHPAGRQRSSRAQPPVHLGGAGWAPLHRGLPVSTPGDLHEREADAMADRVISMPAPEAAQPTSTGHTSMDGGGQPLPASEQRFFEPRFGHDFSQVKVHSDTKAAHSARSLGALAYTVGDNIFFEHGQYAPHTAPGRKLLAHELSHVVQQRSGPQLIQRQKVNDKQFYQEYERARVSGTAAPYPGFFITWDKERKLIEIQADFELRGVEASASLAAQIQASIMQYWNGQFGGFTINSYVTVTYCPPDSAHSPQKGIIELFRAQGKPSTIVKFGSSYPQDRKITLNLEGMDVSWVPAHEFGHYMGLDDKYKETTENGKRVTTPLSGWETNIMAKAGGVVDIRNLLELIDWWANWVK